MQLSDDNKAPQDTPVGDSAQSPLVHGGHTLASSFVESQVGAGESESFAGSGASFLRQSVTSGPSFGVEMRPLKAAMLRDEKTQSGRRTGNSVDHVDASRGSLPDHLSALEQPNVYVSTGEPVDECPGCCSGVMTKMLLCDARVVRESEDRCPALYWLVNFGGRPFVYRPSPTVNHQPGVMSLFSFIGSLLVGFVILYYAAVSLQLFIHRANPSIASTVLFTDYKTDSVFVNYQIVLASWGSPFNSSDYLDFDVSYRRITRVDGVRVRDYRTMEIKDCQNPVVDGALCPYFNGSEFGATEIAGIYESTLFAYVKMSPVCKTGVNCTDATVLSFLNSVTINVYVVESLEHYDGIYYWLNTDDVNRIHNIFCMDVHEIDFSTVYVGLEPPKETHRGTFEKEVTVHENWDDSSFGNSYLRLSSRKLEVRKRFPSLLDVIALVGGFISVCLAMGTLIFHTYNQLVFHAQTTFDMKLGNGRGGHSSVLFTYRDDDAPKVPAKAVAKPRRKEYHIE